MEEREKDMVIAVDFDGTCVSHEFPQTGVNIGAEIVLKALTEKGCNIICLSMRSEEHKDTISHDTITPIKDWFEKNNIPLYALNDNPDQKKWSKSRKVYANIYIDDQYLGCPLKFNLTISNRLFVNWYGVTELLAKYGVITHEEASKIQEELQKKYPNIY